MPLRDIRQLIVATSELEAIRKHARKHAALQQAFVDYTPAEHAYLTQSSRVGYIKAGTLYLFADHAAVAAKLRQLLPRLLPIFSKLDAQVTGIKVELQVNLLQPKAAKRIKKNLLPIDCIEQFENLSKTVRNPELKAAIANLVKKRIN